MIKLDDHRAALFNLGNTITAIDDLDSLIDYYGTDKEVRGKGPAYITTRYLGVNKELQIDRSIFIDALKAQRLRLVNYLATLGIDASVKEE